MIIPQGDLFTFVSNIWHTHLNILETVHKLLNTAWAQRTKSRRPEGPQIRSWGPEGLPKLLVYNNIVWLGGRGVFKVYYIITVLKGRWTAIILFPALDKVKSQQNFFSCLLVWIYNCTGPPLYYVIFGRPLRYRRMRITIKIDLLVDPLRWTLDKKVFFCGDMMMRDIVSAWDIFIVPAVGGRVVR